MLADVFNCEIFSVDGMERVSGCTCLFVQLADRRISTANNIG